MNPWERIIERRIRDEPIIFKNQLGFTFGRPTIDVIYFIRQPMENYREKSTNLHIIFIDLEKLYDRVLRQLRGGF